MMGVYIKGMEMPKDCIVCPFGWNGCNKQHDFVYMGSRPDNCPLVPVPPHGDLIERDALLKKCEFVCTDDDEDIRAVRYSIIENTPTIIETDKADMDSFIRIFEEDDEEDGMDSFIRILKD